MSSSSPSSPPTQGRYALHNWRLAFRIAASAVVTLALALDIAAGAVCTNIQNAQNAAYDAANPLDYGYDDGNYYDYSFCWETISIPICGVALIWNIAELITLFVTKKGIHPGAHIALDFLLFAGLMGSGVIDAARVLVLNTEIIIGAGALELVASLVHLVLFIFACIAVHFWRKSVQQPQQVFVVQQQPGGVTSMAMAPHSFSLPPAPPGTAYLVPLPPDAKIAPHHQGAGVVYYAVPAQAQGIPAESRSEAVEQPQAGEHPAVAEQPRPVE